MDGVDRPDGRGLAADDDAAAEPSPEPTRTPPRLPTRTWPAPDVKCEQGTRATVVASERV